jgi:hypothetical protein
MRMGLSIAEPDGDEKSKIGRTGPMGFRTTGAIPLVARLCYAWRA